MRIERGLKVLVDTNVLLEATDKGRALHDRALTVFKNAPASGADLFVSTQVIREYLVVATRPIKNNGLGMNLTDALANVSRFRQRASCIAETIRAGEVFLSWVERFQLHGKRLHDLQLLATASAAGMDALLTANEGDFPDSSPIRIIPLSKLEG